jgi:hypothetical protein
MLMKYWMHCAVAAAVISISGQVQAGYNFTTGAEYTEGDYGTDITTSTWYVPFTLGYSGEDYALSITVPFISVSGSAEVTGVSSSSFSGKGGMKGGGSSTNTTTTSTETRTDSGLGDVILKGSYQLLAETQDRPLLGVTGKVKFGTASKHDNLGTGETDYSLQLDMAKGPLDGFIGYMWLGDTSSMNYDDIAFGAIAYTLPLNSKWRMRAEYYAEQAATSGDDPVQELNVGFLRPLSEKQNLKLYLIKGFSDSSPDWGAGVMLATSF